MRCDRKDGIILSTVLDWGFVCMMGKPSDCHSAVELLGFFGLDGVMRCGWICMHCYHQVIFDEKLAHYGAKNRDGGVQKGKKANTQLSSACMGRALGFVAR